MAEVTYGSWEGTPTALVVDKDTGEMAGHAWSAAEKRWLPGFTVEAFTKAVEMGEAAFKAAFPGVTPLEPKP